MKEILWPIRLNPTGPLALLSKREVEQLEKSSDSALYTMYRNCSLAVLNVGSETDSAAEIYDKFQSFFVKVLRRERGIKLELHNPPESAFVRRRRSSKVFMNTCLPCCATYCLSTPSTTTASSNT